MSASPLRTEGLGKRYGKIWALRDCSLDIPQGRVAALVGPNGAGKTTLLHLAVGLSTPSTGTVSVFGRSPSAEPAAVLPRVGFVAQDRPLYRRLSVAETLSMGKRLNTRWDEAFARARLSRLGIPLDRKVARLSGGQQSQVALVLALAKLPDLLLLDEPVASLDPLARREFMQTLVTAVADREVTVLLSSHIIADLERVCDYLVILSASRVSLCGDIDDIVGSHRLLTGPRQDAEAVAALHNVVEATHTSRQTTLLAKVNGRMFDPGWEVHTVSLEEIVLAYLGSPMGLRIAEREEVPV